MEFTNGIMVSRGPFYNPVGGCVTPSVLILELTQIIYKKLSNIIKYKFWLKLYLKHLEKLKKKNLRYKIANPREDTEVI